MIKNHWKTLLITSLVILLPILFGIYLWDQLPEQLPFHWNLQGEVDDWVSKPVAVFAMPPFLLAIQWLCVVATLSDPKKDNHASKILSLVFWLIPLISTVLHVFIYAVALGKNVPIESFLPIFMGLLFTVIGNFLPKAKQNYTIGIKIPWTLNSEENWNKTHRLAGWVWTFCGLTMMATAFLGIVWILIGLALTMVFVPLIYSYVLYRKGI